MGSCPLCVRSGIHLHFGILYHTGCHSWRELTGGLPGSFFSELGSPNGLSSGALASMSHDMKRGRTGKDAMKTPASTAG